MSRSDKSAFVKGEAILRPFWPSSLPPQYLYCFLCNVYILRVWCKVYCLLLLLLFFYVWYWNKLNWRNNAIAILDGTVRKQFEPRVNNNSKLCIGVYLSIGLQTKTKIHQRVRAKCPKNIPKGHICEWYSFRKVFITKVYDSDFLPRYPNFSIGYYSEDFYTERPLFWRS